MLRRPPIATAVIAVALGLLLTAGPGAVASEDNEQSYLALGDSVVFGFISGDGFAYRNADNFIGYPDYVGSDLKLNVVNASCPGEASGGFMFPLGALGHNDNGCDGFKTHAQLHVSYAGAATQLDFATHYLRTHPNTRLVTLGLGANDAFILQRTCTTPACVTAGLALMSANIDTILGAIRATGYKGVLEVVSYYSLDYSTPAVVAGAEGLNQFVTASAASHGAVIADGFGAMQAAAAVGGGNTCVAGLLNIATSSPASAPPNCDVHPSIVGQQTLAGAVEDAYRADKQD